jgi:hypothetical protein
MERRPTVSQPKPIRAAKPPIRWTGVLFALAANILLVTLVDALVARLGGALNLELLATIVAPLVAGIATTLYTGERGAVHAFLGGLLSMPILFLIVFRGVWPLAVFAMAFCTLGGAFAEIATRRRPSQ